MRQRNLTILVCLATGYAAPSLAKDAPMEKAEPAARQRLEAVSAAYRALPFYSDEGVFTRSVEMGGKERAETTPLTLAYQRPGHLRLDAGEVEIVGDGTTLTTVLRPTRRYLAAPSPDSVDVTRISDGPAGAILLGGPIGPPSQLLLNLLIGREIAEVLPDRASALKIADDRDWEGVSYPCLLIEQGDEPPLRVLIDPKLNLIRRMEYVLDPGGLGGLVPGESALAKMTLAWNSGAITTEVPATSPFVFHAPEGFKRIEAAKPKEPVVARHALVGKQSPDFSLTVLSGEGKTRKISRDDLVGKIVLLDFWATWCGPCLVELPEIQELAADFARTKRDNVVILAVSEDREPDDGSSVRKLVEDLLAEKKLALAAGPISSVALDTDQSVGDAFAVDAIPTVVLIDAKGIVQAVHIGVEENLKATLEDEIQRLVEGKTLVDPQAQAEKP